jgi:hypothetical protein
MAAELAAAGFNRRRGKKACPPASSVVVCGVQRKITRVKDDLPPNQWAASRTSLSRLGKGANMSHVLNYDGQYFRVEIAEVTNPQDPRKPAFVGWCSQAFDDLKDLPSQALSRFVPGPSRSTHAEALSNAYDWIKTSWDARQTRKPAKARALAAVIYSVWLFRGDSSSEYKFEEFTDANLFAQAAEKSCELTKIGITNNESPQYLTVWERPN